MVKCTVAVRGGISDAIKKGLEPLIAEAGLQEEIFVLDIKSHSFELYADELAFEAFAKRFVGKFSLSYLRGEKLQSNPGQQPLIYVMFGKMQDGALMSRASDLANKMF